MIVEQIGIDAVLTVRSPSGHELLVTDNPIQDFGPESSSWIAAETGTYQLHVAAKADRTIVGRYRVELLNAAPPSDRDRLRVQTEENFRRAIADERVATKQSAMSTIAEYEAANQGWVKLENRYEQALALHRIGALYALLGDSTKAIEFDRLALEIRRVIADHAGEGSTLNNLGLAYADSKDRAKSLDCLIQAIDAYQAINDHWGEALARGNLALAYSTSGEIKQSVLLYQTNITFYHAIGASLREASMLSQLGDVLYQNGEAQKALESLRQALVIYRSEKDYRGEANTLSSIAQIQDQLEQHLDAVSSWEAALRAYRASGDQANVAISLMNLARDFRRLNNPPRSLELYAEALNIERLLKDRRMEAIMLVDMSFVYGKLNQHQESIKLAIEALRLVKLTGDRDSEARTLDDVGSAYWNAGRKSEALGYYQQMLAVRKSLGDAKGEGAALRQVAETYTALDQRPRAIESYLVALAVDRALEDRGEEANDLANVARLYASGINNSKAVDSFAKAISLRLALGDPVGAAKLQGDMNTAQSKVREDERSVRTFWILIASFLCASLALYGVVHKYKTNRDSPQRNVDSPRFPIGHSVWQSGTRMLGWFKSTVIAGDWRVLRRGAKAGPTGVSPEALRQGSANRSHLLLNAVPRDIATLKDVLKVLARSGLQMRPLRGTDTHDLASAHHPPDTSNALVVTIWSRDSILDEQVVAAAESALREHRFFPIRIEEIDPPIGFRQAQTYDLVDFTEDASLALAESLKINANDEAAVTLNLHIRHPFLRAIEWCLFVTLPVLIYAAVSKWLAGGISSYLIFVIAAFIATDTVLVGFPQLLGKAETKPALKKLADGGRIALLLQLLLSLALELAATQMMPAARGYQDGRSLFDLFLLTMTAGEAALLARYVAVGLWLAHNGPRPQWLYGAGTWALFLLIPALVCAGVACFRPVPIPRLIYLLMFSSTVSLVFDIPGFEPLTAERAAVVRHGLFRLTISDLAIQLLILGGTGLLWHLNDEQALAGPLLQTAACMLFAITARYVCLRIWITHRQRSVALETVTPPASEQRYPPGENNNIGRVFLSYSSKDRALALNVAAHLADHGVSLWYDDALQTGAQYRSAIRRAIDSVRVVCVLWSVSATRSAWVKDEATIGYGRGILFSVACGRISIPNEFRRTLFGAVRDPAQGLTYSEVSDLVAGLSNALKTAAFDDRLSARRLVSRLADFFASGAIFAILIGFVLYWDKDALPLLSVISMPAVDAMIAAAGVSFAGVAFASSRLCDHLARRYLAANVGPSIGRLLYRWSGEAAGCALLIVSTMAIKTTTAFAVPGPMQFSGVFIVYLIFAWSIFMAALTVKYMLFIACKRCRYFLLL